MRDELKMLFIADGSLDRPLLHSQGLPLLRRLAEEGVVCTVQSFEHSREVFTSPLGEDLARRGIRWLPVILPSNSSGLDRARMIAGGFMEAWKYCRVQGIQIVHCRSYRPAVIGSLLKTLAGTGFVFDMRGFLIDEQILLGRWQARGLKYSTARQLERHMLLNADMIVTTSPQFQQRVQSFSYLANTRQKEYIVSVPNCVDTRRFQRDEQTRAAYRGKMGWDGRLVVAFAGEARVSVEFGNILASFAILKEIEPRAFLALLAFGNLNVLRERLAAQGVAAEDYCLISVPPEEMPAYLAASDVGIVFLNQTSFTQAVASPIKFGEYLACGLPVVINPGIGDTERILHQYRVGWVVDPANPAALRLVAGQIVDQVERDAQLSARCRQAAEQELSLEEALRGYLRIYQAVLKRKGL